MNAKLHGDCYIIVSCYPPTERIDNPWSLITLDFWYSLGRTMMNKCLINFTPLNRKLKCIWTVMEFFCGFE